jgi:hypothetical protein
MRHLWSLLHVRDLPFESAAWRCAVCARTFLSPSLHARCVRPFWGCDARMRRPPRALACDKAKPDWSPTSVLLLLSIEASCSHMCGSFHSVFKHRA